MTVDVKRKRDKNNFIQIILSKIVLARDFHQRIALAITSKRILNHITLKFYLRKRYNELYLYIRPKDKFGSICERHEFYLDIRKLIPELELTSTQGHFTGWLLHLTPENNEALIKFLKLCSLLAYPDDFYYKRGLAVQSFYNYPETSSVPIHLNFWLTTIIELRCYDLFKTLEDIKPRCIH